MDMEPTERTLRNRSITINNKQAGNSKLKSVNKASKTVSAPASKSTNRLSNDYSTERNQKQPSLTLTTNSSLRTSTGPSRQSLESRSSINSSATQRKTSSPVGHLSSSTTASLLDTITSLESRLKNIEDNSHSQTKLAAIAQLKSELERVQYIWLETADKQNELEKKAEELTSENLSLKSELNTLKSELNDLRRKSNQNSQATDTAKGVSVEQQELNSNIIIRGVDSSSDSAIEPGCIYNSIRGHLGIASDDDFNPISVEFIPTSTAKREERVKSKIIKVQLRSAATKKQFLQIRRQKKDITLADIGIGQGSKKSLLITEQLTRSNQQLLFAARSLRDTHNFKFVWSSDGQILARSQPNAKVIRISEIGQVNELRSQINLPPLVLPKNGQFGTRCNIEPTEGGPQT